jgi:hypothetical protein
MRLTRLVQVFCVALCAATLPAHAETAGKVLTAGGDALVLRGSQILRLSGGAAIESGDQIHTGADGKVLIVFTDSGLIWIRSNSDFVVDEYSYANGRGGRESAFFSLLKGGARSVTGLIGRRNRMSYRLRVSVATIGIRGTDFSVVMCQRDCRDSDGGLAAKGLYGEVLEGRIAVTPLDDRLLEREFRAGEFFHLADEHSAPTPLFLPPPFLRSKADEQARFMEQTGIAIAPGSPGAAPGLSGVVGSTTNGLLTGNPAVGLTGTPTNGLAGTVTGVAGVTSPVAASIGSAVSTVTSPIVSLLAPTVSAVTPVVTSIAAPVVSTVAPLVTSVAAPVVSTVAPLVTSVAAPVVSTITPVVTPIAAPVVSTITPVVTPIAAPAPSVTIPGTISTILPSVLPTSPLKH